MLFRSFPSHDTSDIDNDKNVLTEINPKKMFELKKDVVGNDKALKDVQDYLTKSMDYVFNKTVGEGSVDRRHLETIVSKLTSNVIITDPGDTGLIKGREIDKAFVDRLNNQIALNGVDKNISDVEGMKSLQTLKKGTKTIINKGSVITKEMISELKTAGITKIKVEGRPAQYESKLHSINTVVGKGNNNWFSNLGHENVMKQIARGAMLNQTDTLSDPRSRLMTGKLLS